MRIQRFEFLISQEVTYINLTSREDWAIFKKPKWNLYNFHTEEEISFKSFSDLLEFEIDGKKIRQYIDELPDQLPAMELGGGRGASSGESTFSFAHADLNGGGNAQDDSNRLYPAMANTRIKSKTFEGALAEFKRNHLLANREFAYEVDSDGYVHKYNAGKAHSVGIGAYAKVRRGEKTMLIHNHPSGGAFSDLDLINTSKQSKAKGIVASGKHYDYIFEKGTHFKAEAFIKAVRSAKMKGKNYSDAADKWLKANQKKYGYKYTRNKN